MFLFLSSAPLIMYVHQVTSNQHNYCSNYGAKIIVCIHHLSWRGARGRRYGTCLQNATWASRK
ncbi:hypothetical protein PVAP13_8KG282902 [Panicum virgatum]|uniref:Secreted protein n=1 Tax=Panicum virgatum TaxID=38727 RepID=A0A8T0PNM2_PANVG|nr:hypothetical protein PVAP13_8KG282902 [Panicum virgatum]